MTKSNLLRNGDFEADWSEKSSHDCLIISADGDEIRQIGNIFTPSHWTTWFLSSDDYKQPEVTDTIQILDPSRTYEGTRAMRLFTFYRRHDAGFFQQVSGIKIGTRLRLSAMAHAWSSHPLDGYEDCHNDPGCSMGVGSGARYIPEGEAPPENGDPWDDAIGNFTFSVGIDPTGDIDPFGPDVFWCDGAHIYNVYAPVPEIEAIAQSDTVTVFLRSITKWKFKHNDAYWDDVRLEIVSNDPEPPSTGLPREQYERIYVLLPPGANADWAHAVINARWDSDKWTVGASADDAGIGALLTKRVIAINPGQWPDDLKAWYEEHYPGIDYVAIEADTPELLESILAINENDDE